MRLALPFCLLCAAAPLLSGCALSSTAPSSTPIPEGGPAIHGVAHGGQQPIAGAHVYLYAAGTGGYGGNGIAASTANASQSLLNSNVLINNPGSSGVDGSGNYYVTTDSGGNFDLSNDYSCSTGQQIYLYTLGGNPGSGTNSAASLLAAMGDCSTLSASTIVFADEVSTVATAYALAGFATDATHVSSSGTALAQTGIYNAFANVTNLESLSSGAALAKTPAGNGTVPQSTINTIADILAACINSVGPTSTGCTTLFNNIKSSGATGTSATDTATAAIYLAHWPYPGASQMTALFGSPAPSAPFTPTLGSTPNDFTLALIFNDGATNPQRLAIDASGNVWVANQGNPSNAAGTLSKLSPMGIPASGSPFSGNGINPSSGYTSISAVAIDPSGNVWLPNTSTNTLSEFTNTGAPAVNSPFTYNTSAVDVRSEIVIDSSGNIWAMGNGGQGLDEVSNNGTALSPASRNEGGYAVTGYYLGANEYVSNGLAVSPGGGDILVVCRNINAQTNAICDFKTSTQTFGPIWSGGNNNAYSLAYDSFGSVWQGSYNGDIARFSGGSPGTYDYDIGASNDTYTVVIDGAGTIWGGNNPGLEAFASPGSSTSKPTQLSPTGGYAVDGLAMYAGAYSDIALDGSGNLWYAGELWNGTTASYGVVQFVGIAAPVITPLSAATASSSTGPGTRP